MLVEKKESLRHRFIGSVLLTTLIVGTVIGWGKEKASESNTHQNWSLRSLVERITGRADIRDGDDAHLSQFPFAASIYYKRIGTNDTLGYRCTAAIIDGNTLTGKNVGNKYLLTAAHCFENAANTKWLLPEDFLVYWGYVDQLNLPTNAISARFHSRVEYDGIVVPKDYKFQTATGMKKHDIAVIKLVHSMKWKDEFTTVTKIKKGTVRPAHLPDYNQKLPAAGSFLTALGWGKMAPQDHDKPSYRARFLQYGDVKIWEKDTCQQKYHQTNSEYHLVNHTFCAGGPLKGKTQKYKTGRYIAGCQGDSGSPLVQQGQNGFTVWGIDSQGIAEHKPPQCLKKPVIYTEVSHYIKWIKMAINHLDKNAHP